MDLLSMRARRASRDTLSRARARSPANKYDACIALPIRILALSSVQLYEL